MHRRDTVSIDAYLIDLAQRAWMRHFFSLVFICLAAMLSWTLFKAVTSKSPLISMHKTILARPVDERTVAEHIASSHLFGQDASQISAASVTQVANIQVDGLLYSDDKDSALAILSVDGKSGMFKTGDTLPDGEILGAIGMTAVQITNGPSQRVIELQKSFGGPASGILLAGVEGLINHESFPGSLSASMKPPIPMQRLQTVDVGIRGNPIAKMRALRAKLIKH